jgi:DNA-binding transcriptional regulator YiaG
VNELRRLRHESSLTQAEFAQRLGVPVSTLRMWDSGLRVTPPPVLKHARDLAHRDQRETELLPIRQLAGELGIHKSTLESAIRTGQLPASFSVRSAFGRPIRRVKRADALIFMRQVYGRRRATPVCSSPLPTVPHDFDAQLRHLRRLLRVTQGEFARRVGAASKAVVYQWESRKRMPSPVFWQKVEALQASSRKNGYVFQAGATRILDQRPSPTSCDPR